MPLVPYSRNNRLKTAIGLFPMTTLDHAKVGQMVRIDHIQDVETAMMAIRLGIAVGEMILVASKIPGGPLVIRRGRVDVALGRELCRSIEVTPVA